MSDATVGVTTEGELVSATTLEEHIRRTRDWLDLKLGTGECAEGLVVQLAKSSCRIAQEFGEHEFLVDFHNVGDQIERLEAKSPYVAGNTKPPRKFRRPPLKELWHAHWHQAQFIEKNIALEFNRDSGKAAFDGAMKLIRENPPRGQITEQHFIDAFIYSTIMGGYQRPGSRRKGNHVGCFTGEWIIYAKSSGRNLYLTLGSHAEDAEKIKERCRNAIEQFPELREHPAFFSGARIA
jgi:hypothetical protein